MVEITASPRIIARCSTVSIAVCIGVYSLVQALAYAQIGAFEYPLDDVYIHLAVAEQIAIGGYGVNYGEFTSAASSPLYPLLLTPFAGGPLQVWLPVFWNVAAMLLAAGMWGRIVAQAVSDRRWAIGLAVLGPLAFNLPGLAFVGMEHTIHVLAGMAVLRGLQINFDEGRISWLLIAGMLLGPMVRFEGLAVTGGAALALVLTGRWMLGVTLFAVAGVLIASFAAFLMSLGLEPLPNSVMAKLAGGGQDERFSLSALPVKFIVNLVSDKAMVLFVSICIALAAIIRVGSEERIVRACLTAAIFTGLGHLVLGQFGWFNRYELYAVSFVFGLCIIALFRTDAVNSVRILLLVGMGYLAITYNGWLLGNGKFGPTGIYSQQRNMSNFVTEVYQKPVAVNDLGYVAWNNPNYVLDLWGLASYRALQTRLDNPYEGWAADIVKDSDVELMMIYDSWIDDGIGHDWIKVGSLQFTGEAAFLGDFDVSFYAINEDAAQSIRKQIESFAPRIEGKAKLVVIPEGK